MTLSYSDALAKLLGAVEDKRKGRSPCYEHVPLACAVGRTAARDMASPKSLPEHNTSAMDGYAVYAHTTTGASPETPVVFKVEGSMAAGDDPGALGQSRRDGKTGYETCVEIMTGAIFPDGPLGMPFDACVRVEDTMVATPPEDDGRYILITKPVAPGANKRFAREDITEGDAIVRKGEVIRSSHILPLASVGFESVALVRTPRVAVFSTGIELTNGNGATGDANGPYLTAAARGMGLETDFHGILHDDRGELRRHLHRVAESSSYDVILTSGGVSKGKADHIPSVLRQLDADIVFHGLSIRPGHPVLFAHIPAENGQVAVFGLPGNPGAAAACFRFLAVPYLRYLQGQPVERPLSARLGSFGGCEARPNGHSMRTTDFFRHGALSATPEGLLAVDVSREQSPAKVGPFVTANCWVHFRDGSSCEGEVVDCYPLSPAGTELHTID